MTVSTTTNKIIYPGNGSTTAFPFTFAVPASGDADIEVFFTDTSGNITQLTEGPGSTQYQLTINPTSGTNPTPAGGTVNYNPSGIPIPLNTSLTILRSLPLIQGTSLANQGTLYQPVEEAALDYQIMATQQVLEAQQRALVVPVSDPIPAPVPSATARAGGILGFDSNGNPITVSTVPAGTISGVMQPVVSAASLAAGRTAFGLGSVAVENIGAGLQDNAGSLQVTFSLIGDSSSPQTVNSAFQLTRRVLFNSITYNLPRANTLYAGFGFWIQTESNIATITVNAADSFIGMGSGVSLIIGPAQSVYISTNAANSGLWTADFGLPPSLGTVQNLQLSASVASNALTIALKDRNGLDPSATSPIIFSSGNLTTRAVTGPLSITVPSGATLNTSNNLPNRIWVGLFDNAGTPVLGVYNTLFPNIGIAPWDESTPTNGTAISAGATNNGIWYTNVSVTSKSFRILGYIESTQATAGVWASSPTAIRLFGPGIQKPGDIRQYTTSTTQSAAIAIQGPNFVEYEAIFGCTMLAPSTVYTATISANSGTLQSNPFGTTSAQLINATMAFCGIHSPGSTATDTYTFSGGGAIVNTGRIVLKEIQI